MSTYEYDLNIGPTEYNVGETINSCLKNGKVSNTCVTLYKDGNVVTSGYTVNATVTDTNGDTVSIGNSFAGTYYVKFTVNYNGANRVTTDKITITVNDLSEPEDPEVTEP